MRLVIEIRGGFNAEAILEQLYRLTPLEDSFGINNVALVDGQPRTMGLKELLEVYVAHRYDVVRRRTTFRRRKAQERLHLVDGLLVAILDIDEVIQVIRGSDDTAAARERLMSVFDLTEVQTNHILAMPLRSLTRYSRIELEAEQETLRTRIQELTAILESDALLRETVSGELAEVVKQFGTPRRTVLLESSGTPSAASATPREVADDPCWVLLSSTGLLARTSDGEPLATGGGRAKHDVLASAVRATARGEVAAVTSRGRMVRLGVLDMPALPTTANAPHLSGGAPLSEFVQLERGERVLCLMSLDGGSGGLALGTAEGVVKRVAADYPSNRDAWDVIGLKPGDEVVGAVELPGVGHDLVLISSDAQLLRFPASAVRPQGRAAGGMAGIRLARGARVVFFGAVDPDRDAAVVTVAGSSAALPGTEAGSVKVAPYPEVPPKGRGTGGVRCHRFLRGEDTLILAWSGAAPPRAAAATGVPVDLPEATGKRDGSGTPGRQPIAAVGSGSASSP
jgi:DNA gyrase subunit A